MCMWNEPLVCKQDYLRSFCLKVKGIKTSHPNLPRILTCPFPMTQVSDGENQLIKECRLCTCVSDETQFLDEYHEIYHCLSKGQPDEGRLACTTLRSCICMNFDENKHCYTLTAIFSCYFFLFLQNGKSSPLFKDFQRVSAVANKHHTL